MSAQAHLHGLYPPFTNINFLTEWQQRNAVPPLENVLNDQWTKWQDELGDKALLNGFNTFPINVMGAEDDYMLALNADNCPTFGKAISDNYKTLEDNVQNTFKTFLTRLTGFFGVQSADTKTAISYCQYLKWADLHNVALSFDFTVDDISQCDAIVTLQNQFYADQDQKLGYLAANQFLKLTHD